MTEMILGALVFGCVVGIVLTVQSILSGDAAERLRTRLLALKDIEELEKSGSAIRARYLRQLPPLERWLEELPGMSALSRLMEQGGHEGPAYRIAIGSLVLALAGAGVMGWYFANPWAALAGLLTGGLPIVKLLLDRSKRLRLFEEQLPDGLDLMARALRAGNPLMESFKFISEEMPPPISVDFGRAWSHVNYGVSLKAALYDLIDHAPSLSLRALVTAILVQRETGGNLAEVLDRISHVLRSRQRFARRVRTLTAEGRVSAMILIAMPFVLALVLTFTSPEYLPMLLDDPLGIKLIFAGLGLMAMGTWIITRIVRVRV